MNINKLEQKPANHPFIGTWHIYEMDLWGEDYFNMDVQAYITVKTNNLGDFQFGLVSGGLDGYVEQVGEKERFSFTWEGCDEMDEASGSGWLGLSGDDEVEGMFDFHYGDRSTFKAKKAD